MRFTAFRLSAGVTKSAEDIRHKVDWTTFLQRSNCVDGMKCRHHRLPNPNLWLSVEILLFRDGLTDEIVDQWIGKLHRMLPPERWR
jgi:hypothetical protein